jgi:predicted NBD/HSP70 family sugar kinase
MKLIVEAAREGDAAASNALAETGQFLGVGIANLINALNPERVVFGGILSLASDFLLPVIDEVVKTRALKWSRRGLKIICAEYGFDASAMGGIAKVYQHVLSQPKAAGANRWIPAKGPVQFAQR